MGRKLFDRYQKLSVQAKASIWYTICDFLNKGITFLIIPVYIRLLTTAEYGQWSVFQSWRDILIIFASLNLYCGVFTKKLVDIPNDRDRYTSCMQGLNTAVTLGFVVVYLIGRGWIERVLEMDTVTMVLLLLYFVCFPAYQFWLTRQRVEYSYRKIVFSTIAVTVLVPGISLYLLTIHHFGARAVIYGYLIAYDLIGIVFYILHFVRGRAWYDRGYWGYAVKFNIPLIPHYVSLIALGQADRIMISKYCGDSDAGIYSFAYQIAMAVGVLISAVNGSRVPWTYERLRDKEYAKIKPVASLLCAGLGTITVFVTLLSPTVIHILGTAEYQQAMYVIPVVTMATFLTFVYDLFCGIEFYYGSTKYVMIASCVGAGLNILLNAIFIPMHGFIAAAYTTLVSYFVLMIMHWLFMRKVSREQGITGKVYREKELFLVTGLTLGACFLCMLTFRNDWLRWGVFAVLCIGAIVKRDVFISAVARMKERKTE